MTDQLTKDHADTKPATEVSPPALIRVSWAPIARVNLLPMEIVERRRFHRTQILLGAAVVATILVAGAGTLWAQRGVDDAQDELLTSQTTVSTLEAEKARYAAVPKAIAEVDAAKAARTLAMGSDVLWYRYLNDIDGARSPGLFLDSITVSLNTSTDASAAATNPLSSAGIGTIVATGSTGQYRQVSSWLEAVNKITGFSSASLTGATKTGERVNFSSGATVDTDALSGRFEKEAD